MPLKRISKISSPKQITKEMQKKYGPSKRKCSRCHKAGHNAKTCKTIVNALPVVEEKPVSKEVSYGHKILEEQKKITEREEIDGLLPAAGLWLVHQYKKRIAGKISQVKRNGEIVWKSSIGAIVSTPQEKIKKEGYSYIEDLEPEMLQWEII